MRVYEIVALCPEAAEVMAAYGLHCFSCSVGGVESLEEGCSLHGLTEGSIDALVEDLNDIIRSKPTCPPTLTITQSAARSLAKISSEEGKKSCGLKVLVDTSGGFCMEFQEEPEKDDYVFYSEHEAGVRVFASPLTLWCVGGAVIDFRDGRFKLDLPDN
jgi:hybrid cluster-associated redox disulfide protein